MIENVKLLLGDTGQPRVEHLEQLLSALNTRLVKVLMGQRRAGKSYLLRQIIQSLIEKGIAPEEIFYLNKELNEFDDIADYKQLIALIEAHKLKHALDKKLYIFLDEIQWISGWEKAVNSLSQHPSHAYDIIISGSNSDLLRGELATLLSGRYIVFEILPFSYDEFCGITKQEKSKASYIQFLQQGGLPEMFHLQNESLRRHYIMSLLDTIILKDIAFRYHIKDTFLLERLFLFLTNNISNLFSVNKIVDHLKSHGIKTNVETLSNYLSYLTRTYLLHEVDRYDIKGKEILSSSRKYYLNDLGFRAYLSSQFDPSLSKPLENSIYLHFRRKGFQVYTGKLNQLEIDFIAEKNGTRIYIQVAHTLSDESVVAREFGNLELIHDAHRKVVITLDDVSYGNRNGIEHLLAWELDRYVF